MSGDQDRMSTEEIMKIALGSLCLLVFMYFGIKVFYSNFKPLINSAFIFINCIFLYPFTLFSEKAYLNYQQIKNVNPGALGWDQVLLITEYVGQYIKWFVLALGLIFSFISYKILNSIYKYRRNLDINNLLKNNAKVFPCIAPIVGRNIHEEDPDKGSWKTSRSPIQFALENNLLIDSNSSENLQKKYKILNKFGLPNERSKALKHNNLYLDKEQTKNIFIAQLGPRFESVNDLPDYLKGIAAALISFGHADKKQAQQLLDQMSLSFDEKKLKNPKKMNSIVDITGADKILNNYQNSDELSYYVDHHKAFITTYLHALLVFARQKGVMTTAQFIWLKPTDRLMFYVLNQVGGRTAFTEASGPWAHYLTEEVAQETLYEPEVDQAVIAFERVLIDDGWLLESEK